MPSLTDTLTYMIENPGQVTIHSPQMTEIQSLVIKTFSVGLHCKTDDVNEAREKMFTTGLRLLENLPTNLTFPIPADLRGLC